MNALATTHELKGLQTQLTKEIAGLKILQVESSNLQKKVSEAQNTVNSLQKKIANLTVEAPAPIVSEHAILRYLERKNGLNLSAVVGEILADGTDKSISFMKNGKLIKNGMTLVIRNNVVITVED